MNKNIIDLIIETEKDLYCPYNNEQALNEDITNYLIKESRKKGISDNVVVRIISSERLDEASVRTAFDEYIQQSDDYLKTQTKANLIKKQWMVIVGVVFITLSITLQPRLNSLIFTVLSTIGAFAIWEAASIWIVQNPELRAQARTIGKWKKGIELEFRYDY